MKKIKNYQDACKVLKLNPKALPDVSMLPKKHAKAFIAFIKLTIIAEALNEGWTPNWNDGSAWKYYCYFYVKADAKHPFGVGVSYDVFGYANAGAGVGARLYFRTRELAEYFGKNFNALHKDYLLLPKQKQ